jgi:hypothetical protein
MKRRSFGVAACLAIALATVCCGGGSSVSIDTLQGTWHGTIQNPSKDLGQITVVFAKNGQLTVTTPDGTTTGTAKEERDGIFSYQLSDGTIGGFMVDAGGKHAGFVDENFYFGVVQKDAVALPTYAQGDVVGNWSGTTVHLTGSNLNIDRVSSSSAKVSADGSFSGSDGGGSFSGSFAYFNTAFGRFRGSASESGTDFDVAVFLSADKSFAAGYGCASDPSFPDDCGFTLWHK